MFIFNLSISLWDRHQFAIQPTFIKQAQKFLNTDFTLQQMCTKTDFHNTWWKGGTWAKKAKHTSFGVDQEKNTVRVRLGMCSMSVIPLASLSIGGPWRSTLNLKVRGCKYQLSLKATLE